MERMNAEGERMGLTHTVFANPHGLPGPSPADDGARHGHAGGAPLRDFPESRVLLGDTDFKWRGRVFQRRIPLFRDPGGVTALKTGFTLEAGYNVAVAAGRARASACCASCWAPRRAACRSSTPAGSSGSDSASRRTSPTREPPLAAAGPRDARSSRGRAGPYSGSTARRTMRPSPST